MSIITVTLNPAIDQTIAVDSLKIGEVQRASSVHYNAGGKGIMVASCLADWGRAPIFATGVLGQENATIFEQALKDKSITNQFKMVEGANRTNIKIVDSKETTDINLPGVVSSDESLETIANIIGDQHELAILSGSLPTGMSSAGYRKLISQLSSSTNVILDASGDALIEALKGERLPICVKPNELELSQWAGRKLTSTDDILMEAKRLVSLGIQLVVISMGSDGAYFLSKEGVIRAILKAPKVVTTVGAGDAMVAGIAAAISEKGNLERIARLATAFAVSTLAFIGPHLPSGDVVESFAKSVQIEQVEG